MNVVDIIELINLILDSEPEPPKSCNDLDFNNDEDINIIDITYIVNLILDNDGERGVDEWDFFI